MVGLVLFVGGTSVFMLTAIIRRLRIRRPRLVWRSGVLTRIPIGPSLCVVLLVLGFTVAEVQGMSVPLSAAIGYPAGGLFWFVATWVARSTLVTDYGLVPNVSCLQQAVTWSQVEDYVHTTQNGRPHFVLFYRDRDTQERSRLDLPVPRRHLDDFREILRTKLGARGALSEPDALTLKESGVEYDDE